MYRRLNITLEDDVLSAADAFAKRERYSRSGLIAAALDAFVRRGVPATDAPMNRAITAEDASTEYGVTMRPEPFASPAKLGGDLSLERIGPLVRAYFEGRDDVEAAWVFGSAAQGTAGPMSDVDIAVLPDAELDTQSVSKMRMVAMSRLPGILGVRKVDVVSLPDAPPLLSHRIVVGGTRVYDDSLSRAAVAEITAIASYMDFAPVSGMLDERFTARLAVRDES